MYDADDMGITDLTMSCVNPQTMQPHYDIGSSFYVNNLFGSGVNIEREKVVVPEENFFICGIKSKIHT